MPSNAQQLTLSTLQQAISGRFAAFRRRCRMQPAGGEGDKIFPPTYAGAVYAVEERRIDGKVVPCVLLDSVASQANRMEEALRAAWEAGEIRSLPVVSVDFAGSEAADLGKVTSLDAPHRVSDAILRDSLLDGVAFRNSALGQGFVDASVRFATPLFSLCPTALVFGLWDSTGPRGGLGTKFARAMVSELIGVDFVAGVKTASRIDPLQITKNAGVLYKAKESETLAWTLDEKKSEKKKKLGKDGKPSEANHGNIPPDVNSTGGVTVAYAEQTVVLSLAGLRRLRFPLKAGEKATPEVDRAARTTLAALGLCAATLAAETGFDLRSRCQVVPVEPLAWELIAPPGEDSLRYVLDGEAAIALLNEAVEQAKAVGLPWHEEEIVLAPHPDLVTLIQNSRTQAAQGEGVE